MELKDIATLIEDQGRGWEAFKTANDERLKAIEAKGYAPADLTEKVAKINTDLADIAKQMTEIEKKANRPRADGGKQEDTPEQAEYRKAFGSYLRTGEGDSHSLKQSGRKAMNSTSDPDGGYLIMPEMDMAIDRIVPVMSAMSRLARVVNIGSRSWQKRVKKSGMAMTWTTEGNTAG